MCMRKSTVYKIFGGLTSVVILIGITLVSTFLPNTNWVTADQARLGTIIGLALLAVGFPLSIWSWLRGFKIQKNEDVKELEDIKYDLITMNTREREIAISKARQRCPKKIAMQIHNDCLDVWGTDFGQFIIPIIQSVIIKHDPDPLINFFKGFGDILDSNDYGIKKELERIKENDVYKKSYMDLKQKRLKLKFSKSKKKIIQTNINRIRDLSFGLSSSIILRGILNSIPKKQIRIPVQVRVGLENTETLTEKTLNDMLDNIDSRWKPKMSYQERKDLLVKLNEFSQILRNSQNVETKT